MATTYANQTLCAIANVIRKNWPKVYFGAVPYLDAMSTMDNVNQNYGMDSGKSIVAYFLANATSFKGEVAREIKKELNARIK